MGQKASDCIKLEGWNQKNVLEPNAPVIPHAIRRREMCSLLEKIPMKCGSEKSKRRRKKGRSKVCQKKLKEQLKTSVLLEQLQSSRALRCTDKRANEQQEVGETNNQKQGRNQRGKEVSPRREVHGLHRGICHATAKEI